MSAWSQVVVDATVGTIARFVLAMTTSSRVFDADTFAAWARTMHDHPLEEFYARASRADHFPGDLWLLKVLQLVFSAAGGADFTSGPFELLTNLVPIVADVVVGILIFRLVRQWRSEVAAARAARWYLLNPAVIVLAGAWGQWDAVSIALLLGAFVLLLRGGWAWVGAAPLVSWAVLTKPQLLVPAFVLLLWIVLRPDSVVRGPTHASIRSVVTGAVAFVLAGVATAVVVLQPFRVGLFWTPEHGSSVADRAQYAADLHRFTTMGAANLWLVVDQSVIGPADDVARWGDVTAGAAGVFLLTVLWCAVALTAWVAFGPARRLESLLWAASTLVFASCLVLTRVHERYYFPALVLLLLWAGWRGFDAIGRWMFWTMSALFVVDLVLPMGWTGHDERLLHRPSVLVAVGLLHIVFFVVLLALPWREARGQRVTADGRSAANDARRKARG